MQKEELMLQKRLAELSMTAYQKGIATFTDFLNLNELNILHTMPKQMLSCKYETFGGYGFSERQMAAFLPDALSYEYIYPISAIEIAPLQKKFAQKLSHRDYLGSILKLGVDRCKIGDILVDESKAVVFVQKKLSAFFIDEITRVKHTPVTAKEASISDFCYEPHFEIIKDTVASIRLDSLLKSAFSSSRSKLSSLIEGGKVFVNGKLITSNGYCLKEHDIVSVRGLGRFSYEGILSQTKKGRYYISLKKYI